MIKLTTLSHNAGVYFALKTSHVFEMHSNSLRLVVRVTVISWLVGWLVDFK